MHTLENTRITRAWCMPNRFTFRMAPVAKLLARYCKGVVVDPFSGESSFGTLRNDINPGSPAESHLDAVAFLEKLASKNTRADVLLVDPPYSPRQMKECYSRPGVGRLSCSTSLLMGQIRNLAPSIVRPGGFAITCGWNSNGMGAPFQLVEILIVAHGASHNDTICTVEQLT